jgi:cobalamin biosynthesis Mg chelatase CobN
LLVDPTTTTNTQIQDTDSATTGVTVAPESTEAVDEITFESEDLSGAVEVTEYTSPPQTIKEEVAASITGAGALGEQDGGDGSTSGSDDVNVITVTDISPTTEKAENTPATVTLSVPRSEVDNPQALTVVKEIYDFDAQETTWAALDTTVEETTETEITISAPVEEFSLFAVTEADQATQQQQETDSQDEQQTDQQQDDSGPSAVVVIGGLLALLAIVGVGYFLRQN